MKRSATLLKNNGAAMTGKLILTLYKAYTALFIKQEDFTPPGAPVSQREIILVRRTGSAHKAIARAMSMSLS
jgi:hypothetical protein